MDIKSRTFELFNRSLLVKRIRANKLAVALVVVLWMFLLLTSVSKSYFYYIRQEYEIEIGYIFLRAVLIWGIAALFAPIFIKLAKKFPVDTKTRKYNLVFHLVLSLLFVPVHAALYRLAIMTWYPRVEWGWENFIEAIPVIVNWLIIIAPLNYWLIIGAYYLKKYYDQYRKRQLQNAELEAELASIQLHVLKIQLHPHFLFNTLHNINTLIYEDPLLAEEVLDLLKKMLKKSIDYADRQEVKLHEELEFTQTYLRIEKIRFHDNLDIELDIDEKALDCYVPNLILQPLVENAVKHGVSQQSGIGKICIRGWVSDDHLMLTVEDNGPGLQKAAQNLKLGIGLKNNMQRLDHLYDNYDFKLGASDMGGTKVEVKIPVKIIHEEVY